MSLSGLGSLAEFISGAETSGSMTREFMNEEINFLFIYDLLNDTVSSLHFLVSNYRMIRE